MLFVSVADGRVLPKLLLALTAVELLVDQQMVAPAVPELLAQEFTERIRLA